MPLTSKLDQRISLFLIIHGFPKSSPPPFQLSTLPQRVAFGVSLFLVLFFVIKWMLRPAWCKCNICQAYFSSSWISHFHNLSDWHTHLLSNSPTQTIHIHVLNTTITANPKNVEYILKTKFANFPKGKQFSTILGDLLGKGIFNVDGKMWAFQRKIASLELGSMAFRSFVFDVVMDEIHCSLFPLFSSISKTRESLVLDLQDVFRRFSFDVICKLSFGIDPDSLELSLPLSDFAESFDLATRLSAERALATLPLIWKIKRVLGLGKEGELRKAITRVDLLAKEVIKQKRKLGFQSNSKDLLSRFMGFLDDEKLLRDIVISFVLAGRDTMASALTAFFWLVSKHPHVKDIILEESSRVKGLEGKGNHTSFRLEQVRSMHYLHAAIYESMRLYPPVQFNSKFSLEEDTLPDKTSIKSGMRVTYHPYAMGRMEPIWGPDYLEFKPERWLRNGTFSPVCPFKYPVFQGGMRVCLGKGLALTQMKCTIVALLESFEIDMMQPNSEPRFNPGLTANLRGGLQVVVRKREVAQDGMVNQGCPIDTRGELVN